MKLTSTQRLLADDLSFLVGETVDVCTSQYTHSTSGVPLYPKQYRPVTVAHHKTVAALANRGWVKIVDTTWRNVTVTVLPAIVEIDSL